MAILLAQELLWDVPSIFTQSHLVDRPPCVHVSGDNRDTCQMGVLRFPVFVVGAGAGAGEHEFTYVPLCCPEDMSDAGRLHGSLYPVIIPDRGEGLRAMFPVCRSRPDPLP